MTALQCSSKEQVTMEYTFHGNQVIVSQPKRLVGLLVGFQGVQMLALYVQSFKGVGDDCLDGCFGVQAISRRL